MSRIRITIKLPSLSKKERESEIIKFWKIGDFIEGLKDERKISNYYNKLKNTYDHSIDKLDRVKKAIENLENKGENKFSPLIKKNLEKIEKPGEFSASSLQRFYTSTFYIVEKIVKIPRKIQHEALNYENGEKTIQLLNSFLESLDDLKKILEKRYSEYSVVNHFENALKKYEETKEIKKRIEKIEKKIEEVEREEEQVEKLLREKEEFQVESIDEKEIIKINDKLSSVEKEIEIINSSLKINLLHGRREISKILHSTDKKLFSFFKTFVENPLDNINENFWKMIKELEKVRYELTEKESEKLNRFLSFAENRLNNEMNKLKNLIKEKKLLEEEKGNILSKKREILSKIGEEKERIEKEFKKIQKRKKDLRKERNELQTLMKNNIKMLEIMLSKIKKKKIKIVVG